MPNYSRQVVYGQDGLSAWDGQSVRRIWLDPISTALSFYDASGVRRIWLDGLAVLLSFFDSAGVPRCEIGNLPTRGVSAGGYGFRVNDASGNPIFDSQGVIQAMTQPTGSPLFISTQTVTNLSFTALPSSSITFTTTRTTSYLFDCRFYASYQGPAGTFARVQLLLDGALVGNTQVFQRTAVGAGQTWNGTLIHSASLAAGSHTIQVAYLTDDLTSNLIWAGTSPAPLYVFQLGG